MKPTALALAFLLLVAAGCGEEGPPAPTLEPGARAPRDLPPVDDAAKARFALDRLQGGPLPRTSAFAIPRIHQLNIEHARKDLAALGSETVVLLSDPERVASWTRADGGHNPWHNVLQVLAALDELPADLADRWCRPALAANDVQLARRAVHALVAVHDGPAAAPLLLEFLERRPKDRELAVVATSALARLGEPWRAQAVEVALREGSAQVWSRLPAYLAAVRSDGRAGDDALAWWALLADVGGPGETRGTTRSVSAPWFQGRLLLDDAVWPRDPLRLEVAVQNARFLAPAAVVDAGGFLPDPPGDSEVLAWRESLLTGRASAAKARCRLAEMGHVAFRWTVERDRVGPHPLLVLTAEPCQVAGGDGGEALETARIVLGAFLEDLEGGATPADTGVQSALGRVLAAARSEGVAAGARILRLAPSHGALRGLIEYVHDVLAVADAETLAAEITALLRSEDAAIRAAGLLLVRRGRDPQYAAMLDELLTQASPEDARLIQRLLIWLHSAPAGVDEAARTAFVTRYASWIASAPDAEALVLAPGLLDLGSAGVASYVAGLAGPRRPAFVQGLLTRAGLVPLEVAKALLAPVDGNTAPVERRAVLTGAYRTAPPAAAPYIAALRERIAPGDRAEVDDVLAAVRHRAAGRGTGGGS